MDNLATQLKELKDEYYSYLEKDNPYAVYDHDLKMQHKDRMRKIIFKILNEQSQLYLLVLIFNWLDMH